MNGPYGLEMIENCAGCTYSKSGFFWGSPSPRWRR